MTSLFAHLHNHTHNSLLDGLQKIPGMLDYAKESGMDKIGITDHGTLSGVIDFYKECLAREMKPVIGVEAYMATRNHTDRTFGLDNDNYHLILLAENNVGYQNLIKLITISHLEGFYYKPRIDRTLLTKYKEGLIVLSACASGEVATQIKLGELTEAENVINWYLDLLGPEHYYLELQDHEHQWIEQKKINDAKINLAKKTGAKLVVTADSHYSLKSDREAHEVLLCIQTGRLLTDEKRMSMSMDLNLKPPEEIISRWKHIPEVYENTIDIADRCNIDLGFGNILIPEFPMKYESITEEEYLCLQAWQGALWRYANIPKEKVASYTEIDARKMLDSEVVERMDIELEAIKKMGFCGYFLIVADFINWGKDRGILFGPGRGSAIGSIISYCLNITTLDPLYYDLLFERFLNPERISMPDIDIDIQEDRRDEVIEYVKNKYGEERVAHIVTFVKMAARTAIRDAGRVFGMPYGEVDAIAKMTPETIQGRHVPLEVTLGLKPPTKDGGPDPDLVDLYKKNVEVKRLLDTAIKLEGTNKSNGVHAAGLVITPGPVVDYVPMLRAQKGGYCTQYPMEPIEDLGLLKMDFLGLANLTIVVEAIKMIKKYYGKEIDLDNIPMDDPDTFQLLRDGNTVGLFQVESRGLSKYMVELQPSCFDDIIAMVALYRPGPMQWIDKFINCKLGKQKPEYFHPVVEPILRDTYSVLVYQEQVMKIAKVMCGFTGAEADTLRKAIGKKKPEVMAKMKEKFIEGALRTIEIDRKSVEEFWASLEDFAAYCFNKSHAAGYAMICYWTAYLKAHYPAAFMTAVLSNHADDLDRLAFEISETKQIDIDVLPPNINESMGYFKLIPETNSIQFGLNAIRGLGSGLVESLIGCRTDQPFRSIGEFIKTVGYSQISNKKVWEALIKSGALNDLEDQNKLWANIDKITDYCSILNKEKKTGQMNLFGGIDESITLFQLDDVTEPVTDKELFGWEKNFLGLYLTRSPLDAYTKELDKWATPISDIDNSMQDQTIIVGGLIVSVRKIMTKKNQPMAFAQLEDRAGTRIELVVFPNTYNKFVQYWNEDAELLVRGKVDYRDRNKRMGDILKLIVDQARFLESSSSG
jgi:DNA polymerase-3 subunit alpha